MTLPHGPGGLGSTYATTFNLTIAFADPSGADYALHLRDIDAIATQLLHLQAANGPVLWRPLHEADWTWFWPWGAPTGLRAARRCRRSGHRRPSAPEAVPCGLELFRGVERGRH